MDDFLIYLGLGFDHITDPGGYDHVLFIVALCAVYILRQWRQVLVLVTAFTLGHSITLALATLRLVSFRSDVIELLIPITILITAVVNLFFREDISRFVTRLPRRHLGRYVLAGGFGLIHGLGFSNYLRSLLGHEADIWQPLLAFNLGLELGQLLIVAFSLTVAQLALQFLHVRRRDWVLIVSGVVAGMALSLIINNPLLSRNG
ncbi:HupE/UreJ family protein [Fibrella aquatilis]|uniref:HupE/UreJ family protein n=1 Tax=Fibrella aquatilis TaxID=2817059 RepID=A0A939K0H7_9BACT|nr:HupE/UreJ family protein [Fibrella aquatilis]MBO0934209.1 HupE/UreJ family protein [Fibrella aquatilis]